MPMLNKDNRIKEIKENLEFIVDLKGYINPINEGNIFKYKLPKIKHRILDYIFIAFFTDFLFLSLKEKSLSEDKTFFYSILIILFFEIGYFILIEGLKHYIKYESLKIGKKLNNLITYNYLLTSEVLPNEENLKLLNPEIKNNYNLYEVVEDFQEQTGINIFNSYLEDVDKYKKK